MIIVIIYYNKHIVYYKQLCLLQLPLPLVYTFLASFYRVNPKWKRKWSNS